MQLLENTPGQAAICSLVASVWGACRQRIAARISMYSIEKIDKRRFAQRVREP